MHLVACGRQRKRKTAVVAERVEQPAARVARRGDAVLALIEKQSGFLAAVGIDEIIDGAFAHLDPVGHGAMQHVDALLEPFEQPDAGSFRARMPAG